MNQNKIPEENSPSEKGDEWQGLANIVSREKKKFSKVENIENKPEIQKVHKQRNIIPKNLSE